MAKKRNQNIQNTTQSHVNTFMGGMNRDSDPSFIKKGEWTHARNAVNTNTNILVYLPMFFNCNQQISLIITII